MPSDPLSDVLRLMEAKSVVVGGFVAGGSWALRCPPPERIKFSAMVKGWCWLRVDGQREAIRLEQGDVFLLSGRDGFLLASNLKAPPKEARQVFGSRQNGSFASVGGGSDCVVLTGQVMLHPSSGALLTDVLPPLVHVRAESPEAKSLRWIVKQLLAEGTNTQPGTSVASAQLAHLMFIQVLRAHLASSGGLPPGWLRAISDERIARALRLMHDEPGKAWKLDELARAAGMSRTSFAVHFKSVAGVAPLAYLTEWRMRLAQRALRDEATSMFELAESLGYASESAFSNAFKRVTGSAPRSYRTAARAAL